MRTPFIAGNWKMFKTVHEAVVFAKELRSLVKDASDVEIVGEALLRVRHSLIAGQELAMEEIETAYYLRLRALDRPGVLADVTRICADLSISIDAIFQKEAAEGEDQVDVVILTHLTVEKNINAALRRIEGLATIPAPVVRIRLEELL